MSDENKVVEYKALKDFEVGPESSHTLYEAGAIFQATNIHLDIPALLADGTIEVITDTPEIVEGPVEEANPEQGSVL